MVEDADAKQALLLAQTLRDAIAEITDELAAPRSRRPPRARDQRLRNQRDAELRDQLREAHRLLDRLCRRFPEVQQSVRPAGTPVRCGVQPNTPTRITRPGVSTR